MNFKYLNLCSKLKVLVINALFFNYYRYKWYHKTNSITMVAISSKSLTYTLNFDFDNNY